MSNTLTFAEKMALIELYERQVDFPDEKDFLTIRRLNPIEDVHNARPDLCLRRRNYHVGRNATRFSFRLTDAGMALGQRLARAIRTR